MFFLSASTFTVQGIQRENSCFGNVELRFIQRETHQLTDAMDNLLPKDEYTHSQTLKHSYTHA